MAKTSPDVPGTWEYTEPPRPKPFPWTEREQARNRGLDVAYGSRMEGAERYTLGNCTAFVVQEPAGKDGAWLWHLSISHPKRHPTWDEIKAARYWLLPLDITVGVLLPPPEQYVNVPEQDHVFHLWQVNDARGK